MTSPGCPPGTPACAAPITGADARQLVRVNSCLRTGSLTCAPVWLPSIVSAQQAAGQSREEVSRARVDLGRPSRGELVTADATAQQTNARDPGLLAGPYIPDRVAGEYCLFGQHAHPVQRHLDQIRGGLAGLDVTGEGGRVDRVLGVQGAAQRVEFGFISRVGQHHRQPPLLTRPQQVRGTRQRPQLDQYVAYRALCAARRSASASLSRPAGSSLSSIWSEPIPIARWMSAIAGW